MQMMNFAILRGRLSQSSRSLFQKSVVLDSGSPEYILKRGYAKLRKRYAIDSYRAKSRSTPDKIEENGTNHEQVNCTNEEVNCTNEQVVKCSNYQVEEFRGEDFCGEDFCGEVFSGGEDFCGDEFHGEDFDKEEFEGDKIFRSVEFISRIPISSKTATRVDDFVAYIYNRTHQDEEK